MEPQEFTVQSVARGFAAVTPDLILQEDGVLDSSPETRIVFRAEVHSDGVRGRLIKQKKGRREEWEDTEKIDFRKLKTGEGTSLELSTSALARLAEQYAILKSHLAEHGVRSGARTYVSGERDQVIVVDSTSVADSIKALLETTGGEAFWSDLADDRPAMLRRIADGAVHEDRRRQLGLFKRFLDDHAVLKGYADSECIDASKDEKIWQHFFEQNPWIFGYGLDYRYMNILQREAVVGGANVGGSDEEVLDFLMGTTDYTVLVELKTAATPLLAARKNRSNSWRLSNDLFFAESQIIEQKASFESYANAHPDRMFRREGDRIGQATLNPKIILVIGNRAELRQGTDLEQEIKQRTFEIHRRELATTTVLTFDELYERAAHIVEVGGARLG